MKVHQLSDFVKFCQSFDDENNLEIVCAICPTVQILRDLISALVEANLTPVREYSRDGVLFRLSNDLRLYVGANQSKLPLKVGKADREPSAIFWPVQERELQHA